MLAANRPVVPSVYDAFEALESSPYTFVIWNLYLTDKVTPLTTETLKRLEIAHIVAILPEEDDFPAKDLNIPFTVLAYNHNHTPTLPKEQYDEIAKTIDRIAKGPRDKPRNILVFCNNGFQRSIPFLVYYMTKYHAGEFPTVDKAVGFVFSQIGARNRFEDKQLCLANIRKLFLLI